MHSSEVLDGSLELTMSRHLRTIERRTLICTLGPKCIHDVTVHCGLTKRVIDEELEH